MHDLTLISKIGQMLTDWVSEWQRKAKEEQEKQNVKLLLV